MTTLREAAQQALEALERVDLHSLVPDYGSGHYSVARLDGPQVKSAITNLRAALAEHYCDTHCTWADHAAGCVRAHGIGEQP